MSTRSIIGYYENKKEGKWHGVFHHWDGYPKGVGLTLLSLGKDKGVEFIKKEIVDKHPTGWSTINRNWELKPVSCQQAEKFKECKAPEFWAKNPKSTEKDEDFLFS
ncbi:unnamed protein product, partial [marine sediment metagenome]